jgi:hypothetical protein
MYPYADDMNSVGGRSFDRVYSDTAARGSEHNDADCAPDVASDPIILASSSSDMPYADSYRPTLAPLGAGFDRTMGQEKVSPEERLLNEAFRSQSSDEESFMISDREARSTDDYDDDDEDGGVEDGGTERVLLAQQVYSALRSLPLYAAMKHGLVEKDTLSYGYVQGQCDSFFSLLRIALVR